MHKVRVDSNEKVNVTERVRRNRIWSWIRGVFAADPEPWVKAGVSEQEYVDSWAVK